MQSSELDQLITNMTTSLNSINLEGGGGKDFEIPIPIPNSLIQDGGKTKIDRPRKISKKSSKKRSKKHQKRNIKEQSVMTGGKNKKKGSKKLSKKGSKRYAKKM